MSPRRTRSAGELEIEEDLDFQRREWRFQKFGGAMLWALVAGGVLGAFGDGPLSRTTVASPGRGWLVEYDRVVRVGASTDIVLREIDGAGGDVTVSLGGDLLDYDIERVRPDPTAVETADGRVRYHISGHGRGGQIVFRLRPKSPGRTLLVLDASWTRPLHLRQVALF